MSQSTTQKSAFTLIEMLLVVSLIVLLISMLLPALHQAREVTKDRTCEVNLRQIYGATVAYTGANVKYIPLSRGASGIKPWVYSPWTGSINNVRNGSLYPYIESDGAYLCPKFDAVYRRWNPAFANSTAIFSYSLNEYFGNSWMGQAGVRTIDGPQKPAELLMYSDENAWKIPGPPELSRYTINNGALGVGRFGDSGSIVDCVGTFHNAPSGNYNKGMGNVVFIDGHIDQVAPEDSKEVATPERYK
jgi:prepilin-type processing-associated H-X9-DG protein